MDSYTILTVFENTDTLNEPVMSLPLLGRMSFRQIGIVVGLSILAPLALYSGMSGLVLDAWPEPAFSFEAVGSQVAVTWDVVLAVVSVPFGLILGIPRPKLLPMDGLVAALVMFAVRRTSVSPAGDMPAGAAGTKKAQSPGTSRFVGFARMEEFSTKKTAKKTFTVGVSELEVPKDITMTLYDFHGLPMRHRLARAYVDDALLSSMTTDSDGVMGMVFAPKSEGAKSLRVIVNGIKEPVVDVNLDVRIQN